LRVLPIVALMRRHAVLLLAPVLLLPAACGTEESDTAAGRSVRALADSIAADLGSPLDRWEMKRQPCSVDDAESGSWMLLGSGTVSVPVGEQMKAVDRLLPVWEQRGYIVTERRNPVEDLGEVSVVTPDGALSFDLGTGSSGPSVSLMVGTVCSGAD
jgi:hypothetical protein